MQRCGFVKRTSPLSYVTESSFKDRSRSLQSMDSSEGRGGRLPFADINGKVALIALGSDEDEGINLAVEFVKHGCKVVLAGCPIARVTDACSQVQTRAIASKTRLPRGDFVKAVELDVSRGDQAVEAAMEEAWGAFGVIDIVLSCTSGLGTLRSVTETSDKDFDKIMATNLKAVWEVSKFGARKMQQEGRTGSVLFLTSISGTERGIYPGVSVYGTSLAAINHLTKMMAMELGKYGIRVNAIACGVAEPNIVLEGKDSKEIEALAKRVVPLRRWLQFPSDISGVMFWLASDSSSFVTGTITIVDGGLSLRRPRLGEYRSRL